MRLCVCLTASRLGCGSLWTGLLLSGSMGGIQAYCVREQNPEKDVEGLSESVSLAGLAAHLSEIWPAAELKSEHQRAVGHSVHIFALFRVVCTDGQTEVTFALALLHGCRPLVFQAFVGWLSDMRQTLH